MKTKQDEILEADYMDQNSKTKYASDINNVHQQILSSLQAICPTKDQKVTERQLLDMLKQKMPNGKKLNTSLFLQVFQDLNRDLDNKIDLNEFVVKYIHSHEELRMFLELGKQEMENQQNLKSELENQAFEAKNEQLNKYNISLRSEISIQIQKVQLYNQGDSSDIFFRISYEGDSKKTSSRSVNDLNFIEKISFPVEKLETTLVIDMHSVNSPDDPLGSTSVPLHMLITNEEAIPSLDLLYSNMSIGTINPKLLLITSYNDYYQKELQNTENKIQDSQTQLRDFAERLESLSEPFKYAFDQINTPISKKSNVLQDKAIDSIEQILKSTIFKKNQRIIWQDLLKYVLIFCIFTSFFTTLERIDFFSMFIQVIFYFMLTTRMTKYFNEHFCFAICTILCTIIYDLIDFFCLRETSFPNMGTVRGIVKIFGFLGFLGKILWFIFFWVAKVKVFSKI